MELKCPYCRGELKTVFKDKGSYWVKYYYCQSCKALFKRIGYKFVLIRRKVFSKEELEGKV